MSIEQSFVMMKPDAVQRSLVAEVISRLERKGLKICAMKMLKIDRELAEKHYGEHQGKPFYDELVRFVISSPVIAMVIEGENAVSIIRKLVGATKVEDAVPGTLRGDFGLHTTSNIVHASDSIQTAAREIRLFFKEDEIFQYERQIEEWI